MRRLIALHREGELLAEMVEGPEGPVEVVQAVDESGRLVGQVARDEVEDRRSDRVPEPAQGAELGESEEHDGRGGEEELPPVEAHHYSGRIPRQHERPGVIQVDLSLDEGPEPVLPAVGEGAAQEQRRTAWGREAVEEVEVEGGDAGQGEARLIAEAQEEVRRVYVEGLQTRSFWLSPVGGLVVFAGSLFGSAIVTSMFSAGLGYQVGSTIGAFSWFIGYGAYLCVYAQQQPWLPVYAIVTVHQRDRWGQVVLRTEERPVVARMQGRLSCKCWRLMESRWIPLQQLGVSVGEEVQAEPAVQY